MGVSAEEQVGPPRLLANFLRQCGKGLAKASCGAGFDQRRSSSGRVSPRRCSASASSARRRSVSPWRAKRVAQAASSSSSARIWEAMASCSCWGRVETFSRAFSNSLVTTPPYQTARLCATRLVVVHVCVVVAGCAASSASSYPWEAYRTLAVATRYSTRSPFGAGRAGGRS